MAHNRTHLSANDLSLEAGFLTAKEDDSSLLQTHRQNSMIKRQQVEEEDFFSEVGEVEDEERNKSESLNDLIDQKSKDCDRERLAKFTIGDNDIERSETRGFQRISIKDLQLIGQQNSELSDNEYQSNDSAKGFPEGFKYDANERFKSRQAAWLDQKSSMFSQMSTLEEYEDRDDEEKKNKSNYFDDNVYGDSERVNSSSSFVAAGKVMPINKEDEIAVNYTNELQIIDTHEAQVGGTCSLNNNSSYEYGSCEENFENSVEGPSQYREQQLYDNSNHNKGGQEFEKADEKIAKIKIKIEDYNNLPQTSRQAYEESLNLDCDRVKCKPKEFISNYDCHYGNDNYGNKFGLVGSSSSTTFLNKQLHSNSALDVRLQLNQDTDKGINYNRLTTFTGSNITGSLSDNSHERRVSVASISCGRPPVEELLKNWKESNQKSVSENPFNLHIDCLERLTKQAGIDMSELKQVEEEQSKRELYRENLHSQENAIDYPTSRGQLVLDAQALMKQESSVDNQSKHNEDNSQQREQRLKTYAAQLTHLYKRNQAIMDNNADFRSLLYNIVCCLLIQDSQVLSTISVTKMIDVIRAHLESTSKFYWSAMQSITTENNCISEQHKILATAINVDPANGRRKSSLGSVTSCTSSASSGFHNSTVNNANNHVNFEDGNTNTKFSSPETTKAQKPADFRRIFSVSYNDEQLINDLCDIGTDSSDQTNPDRCGVESPWKFEELSSECKHHNGFMANQASLDNNHYSNMLDLMNDSGIGTVYDSNLTDHTSPSMKSYKRRQNSPNTDFKPKQKPPYMSTDDYLSQFQDDSNGIYDDNNDSSCILNNYNSKVREDLKPVDVASRRSELEWTLNKLINFELKYAWLTSRDTLRRAIRKIGVPNEIRGKVWLILIDQMIGTKYDAEKLLDEASKTISEEDEMSLVIDDETSAILKQIELDVNRTMPGHKLFDDGAEGGIKLRRILVAYSIHVNRAIAYCQGFNFIVALLLSVFEGNENRALSRLKYIESHRPMNFRSELELHPNGYEDFFVCC